MRQSDGYNGGGVTFLPDNEQTGNQREREGDQDRFQVRCAGAD
jgi:hypothetical protein